MILFLFYIIVVVRNLKGVSTLKEINSYALIGDFEGEFLPSSSLFASISLTRLTIWTYPTTT